MQFLTTGDHDERYIQLPRLGVAAVNPGHGYVVSPQTFVLGLLVLEVEHPHPFLPIILPFSLIDIPICCSGHVHRTETNEYAAEGVYVLSEGEYGARLQSSRNVKKWQLTHGEVALPLALSVDPITVVCVINLPLRIPISVGLFAHPMALASLPLAVVPLSSESIVTPSSLLQNNRHRVYSTADDFQRSSRVWCSVSVEIRSHLLRIDFLSSFLCICGCSTCQT